jgi:type VI secretion system secreted protein Hcp
MYLSIAGVTGDATNGLMLVDAFQWSMNVSVSPPTGGPRTVSPPMFSDLTVTKQLDSASPKLAFFCASASGRATAVLTVKDRNTGNALYTITLTNVYITAINSSGAGERPTETISMTFDMVQWTYQRLGPTGNPVGPPVTNTWNVIDNMGS